MWAFYDFNDDLNRFISSSSGMDPLVQVGTRLRLKLGERKVKGVVKKVKKSGKATKGYRYTIELADGGTYKTTLDDISWSIRKPCKNVDGIDRNETSVGSKNLAGDSSSGTTATVCSSSAVSFIPGTSSVLDHIKYTLAPMVGASELPFRLLCRKYGATIAYTPMINSAVSTYCVFLCLCFVCHVLCILALQREMPNPHS